MMIFVFCFYSKSAESCHLSAPDKSSLYILVFVAL